MRDARGAAAQGAVTPLAGAVSSAALGPVVSTHRVASTPGGRFALRIGFEGLVLVVVARMAARMIFGSAYAVWAVTAVAVLGFVAYAFVRRAVGMTLVVHEQGLAIHRKNEVLVLPWKQLDAITFVPRGTSEDPLIRAMTCSYELRAGEQTIELPVDLEGVGTVAARIESAIEEHRFPAARASLDAGGEVRFGDVVVNAEGVRRLERLVPWTDIAEVRREVMVVDLVDVQGKRKLEVDLQELPNPGLFTSLVRRKLAERV